MNITIEDVARMAKVSKGTVSAVLNEKSTVSEKTRAKVLAVIKKLNYRPNLLARSLSIQKTKSIGLVIKEIDNPYFTKIMKGVFDSCTNKDYIVLLGSSELSPVQETKHIETLINQRVAGLIISPLQGEGVDLSYIADLLRDNYPLVMLGSVKNFLTNAVDVNNVEAAYQAVRYLIELGHKNIAYFAGPSYSIQSFERMEGYQNALSFTNVPMNKKNIVQVGSYMKNGYDKGKEIFSNFNLKSPTAVFCYNDLVAIGLMNALTELGINIPEQVSIIGFDDINMCDSFKIPLTTIRVPAYQIGQTAANILVDQITNGVTTEREKQVLKAELVKRSSCTKLH